MDRRRTGGGTNGTWLAKSITRELLGSIGGEQAVQQHDVRIHVGDGGVEESTVGGPGGAPGDDDRSLAEVGDLLHRATGGRLQPQIGGRAILQWHRQPRVVGGEIRGENARTTGTREPATRPSTSDGPPSGSALRISLSMPSHDT